MEGWRDGALGTKGEKERKKQQGIVAPAITAAAAAAETILFFGCLRVIHNRAAALPLVTSPLTTYTQDLACVLLGAAPSLTITSVSVTLPGGSPVLLPTPDPDRTDSVLVLDLRAAAPYLAAGTTATLNFEYTAALGGGSLQGKVSGWIRSS
jgi:hypothetical protein